MMTNGNGELFGRKIGILLTDALRMKESGEQYDDRIIEVCWNAEVGGWKMMRIRDDKPHANHKSIMQKILISIEDGVELGAVSLGQSEARDSC